MPVIEKQVCDTFMKAARDRGWTCYPETSDWDILLVRDDIQIGVQAKVKATFEVLLQALPGSSAYWWSIQPQSFTSNGPDYRAVLVHATPPSGRGLRNRQRGITSGFIGVARALKLLVFSDQGYGFTELTTPSSQFCWRPQKRCWIPELVPQVPAGVPSPLKVTQWKEKALKLLALAHVQGYITSKDAKALGLNMQTFTEEWRHWLDYRGRQGRFSMYALTPVEEAKANRPDLQHPDVFQHYVKETAERLGVITPGEL